MQTLAVEHVSAAGGVHPALDEKPTKLLHQPAGGGGVVGEVEHAILKSIFRGDFGKEARTSQEEQNGPHFSSIAPSRE